ncbi:MAG TPA: N-acetyltransferase [Acidobacteriaceae bacterium]
MIRLAGLADVDAIIALEHTAREAAHWSLAEYALILRGPEEGAALRRWSYVFESEAGSSQDGSLLGFIVVKLLRVGGEAQAEIENLAVAATARRRGVGSALCRAALQRLQEEGAETVELEVRAGNSGAVELYSRLGFETAGIRPDYYSNPKEDARLFRVHLPVPNGESAGLIMRIDG